MYNSGVQTEGLNDSVLIQKILNGEQNLYEQIIRRYNQRLYRVGMSILKNAAEVEDAMQVCYIKAYEHLVSFEQRSSFGTWLTRIMLNECLAQKNKKNRRKEMRGNEDLHFMDSTTPVNLLMNKELSAVLETAIAGLPEKYRMVFILREIENMSVKQTSEVLSLQETNIKVRLNRAKTMLRENLDTYMKENIYSFHLSRCNHMVEEVFRALQINGYKDAETDFPAF